MTVEELTNYSNLTPENKARFLEIKAEEEHEKEIEDKKKNSPFANWLQVNNSKDAYKAESWLIRESPIAYQVLRFLASEMDNYNAIVCSFKVMQEVLGYKRTSLSNAVALLKEHKYIDVKKSGSSNVYLINKELYWKSYGKNHRFAEFGAKIIITASEQENEKTIESKKYQTAVVTPKGKTKTKKTTVVEVADKTKDTATATVTPATDTAVTDKPVDPDVAEFLNNNENRVFSELSDALEKQLA